jgi:hypothetical protein
MTIPDEKKLQKKTSQSNKVSEKFLPRDDSNRRKGKCRSSRPRLSQQKTEKTNIEERTAPEKLRVTKSIKHQQRTKENIHPKQEIYH